MDDIDDPHAAGAHLVAELIAGRRRLERALHDGVQQDLTALAVQLQLAREQLANDPAAAVELLDAVRLEVHAAIDGVRALAEEVYPPLLDAHGLAAALPGAARAAGVRLRLDDDQSGRASLDAEAAALFACRAVFEQSGAGAEVRVELRTADDRLRVEARPVEDQPPAFVRDLVEGAGGTLEWSRGRLVLSLALRDRG